LKSLLQKTTLKIRTLTIILFTFTTFLISTNISATPIDAANASLSFDSYRTVPLYPIGPNGATKLTSTSSPVLDWNGYSYWSFSYTNNARASYIVAFDNNTDSFVQGWHFTTERYVNNITWDDTNIHFKGQYYDSPNYNDGGILVAWDTLRLPSNVSGPSSLALLALGLFVTMGVSRRRKI
jgi:hypothetical protein